jgi:hypothetical protein
MKKITCSRCKGKGYLTSQHVVHMGFPGGCFKCDMNGNVITLTPDERRVFQVNSLTKHQDELIQLANDIKTTAENSYNRRVERSKKNGFTFGYTLEHFLGRVEPQLESLRSIYRTNKQVLNGETKTTFPRTITVRVWNMLSKALKK